MAEPRYVTGNLTHSSSLTSWGAGEGGSTAPPLPPVVVGVVGMGVADAMWERKVGEGRPPVLPVCTEEDEENDVNWEMEDVKDLIRLTIPEFSLGTEEF